MMPIAKVEVVPATAMSILLVEDNSTDRELLRYLLEARLHPSSKIFEAPNLQVAFLHLEQNKIDCVLLDLRLPDSAGKETFSKMAELYPTVPIIVITHTKDRELAVNMIKAGAADYLLKDYTTDEEAIFQRIMLAVTRHRQSIRVSPDQAGIFHRLDRAQASITQARRRRNQVELQTASADTSHAMADVSRQLFAEVQAMKQVLAQHTVQQGHLLDNVQTLNKELLHGRSGRPSMKSQMNLLDHRLTTIEVGVGKLKADVDEAEDTQRREAIQLVQAQWSNRTKILIAVLTLIGVAATATATYFAAIHKPVDKPPAGAPNK
jgi:DNA-binding response OmpR family regulator